MQKPISALLLSVICSAGMAQEMYTCVIDGKKIFQDRPCKGMPIKPVENPDVVAHAAIEAGKALCGEEAPKLFSWKDPESVRVGNTFGGIKIVDVKMTFGTQRGRVFFVPVNAKNSYGGYNGEKSLVCYTNTDGSKILNVDSILLNAR